MKNICFIVFALFLTNLTFAQDTTTKIKAAQSTYSLTETQTNDFMKIETRYAKNLADIQILKDSDPELYQQKMLSLMQGNDSSMRRLLNKEQLKIYQAIKLERRKERAAYVTALKTQGKSKEEMKKALVEWELTH